MRKKSGKKELEDRFGESWRLPTVRLLLLVALGVSGYLLYVSVSSGAVAGCGPDSGCDRVLKSRWAYWFGLPVSSLALPIYATLLGVSRWLGKSFSPASQRKAWALMFALAVCILGAATWFLALMVFVIKALCPFCLVAHSAGFLAALLIVLNAPIRPVPELPWQQEKHLYLPPGLAKKIGAVGLAAVTLLAIGQVAYQKPTNVVKALPMATNLPLSGYQWSHSSTNPLPISPSTSSTTARTAKTTITNRAASAITNPGAPANPPALAKTNPIAPSTTNRPSVASANPGAATGRVITTHNGAFQFNVDELPLIGSPTAPRMVVSLFDYTCHHCQIMHGHLLEAQRALNNQVAFISLPMPLDAECNPQITRTHYTASNACQYARLGLAVWRADRTRFHQFDDWMFSHPKPPSVAEATGYAANLVGNQALTRSLGDSWINQQLQKSMSIYHTNMLMLYNGAMPQLIVGSRVSFGNLRSAADVVQLIRQTPFEPTPLQAVRPPAATR